MRLLAFRKRLTVFTEERTEIMGRQILWDCHMHSSFSADSDTPMEVMIHRAVETGLQGITFTEHLDPDYPVTPDNLDFSLDIPAYKEKLAELSDMYKDKIQVRFGIELGLQMHLGEYFESILENISAYDGFDVYGHIDYVVRYGPNKNREYSYGRYKDILDEILKKLISMGKGIELNTGGYHYGLGEPNPCTAVIRRYRELGGEIITIGADAHTPDKIACAFDKAASVLEACGFRYYTIFKDRKPEFISL